MVTVKFSGLKIIGIESREVILGFGGGWEKSLITKELYERILESDRTALNLDYGSGYMTLGICQNS